MTINSNNYPGASITLVGYAANDAEFPAYDKSGERGISQIRVPINQGYKKDGEFVQTGTAWYTVSGKTENIGHVRKGDKIRLDDAKLEAREFTRKDGSIGQAFETSYGTLTVIESKGGGSAPADDDSAPF